MPTREALRLAEEQGLDLVEVSPHVRPPVCKIMDYGKYKYELKQKEKERRRSQTVTVVKEIKLRPKTDVHDVEIKTKRARKFLEARNKVKVTITFRGREVTHQEIGLEHLRTMAAKLQDVATIESAPRMEYRTMHMILAPKS